MNFKYDTWEVRREKLIHQVVQKVVHERNEIGFAYRRGTIKQTVKAAMRASGVEEFLDLIVDMLKANERRLTLREELARNYKLAAR